MFYRKEIAFPKVKQKAVSLAQYLDGSKTGLAETPVNFKAEGGALKDGFGLDAMRVGERIFSLEKGVCPLKIYFYPAFDSQTGERKNKILVYADNGKMYASAVKEEGFFEEISYPFTQAPSYIAAEIDSEDALVFYGKEGVYVYDGEFKKTGDLRFSSLAASRGRFFGATDSGELWYGEFLKPVFGLDEGGFILAENREPGGSVVEYKDCVYLFRREKIYRVSHDGRAESITFAKLPFAADRIYGETAVQAGLKLLFLTNGGFYLYDGSNFKETAPSAKPLLKGKDVKVKAKAVYGGEVYYSFEADGQNLVLSVNPENESVYVFDAKARIEDFCFCSTGTEQILSVAADRETLCALTENAEVFSQPLVKRWKTRASDFGVRGRVKFLKEIYVRSETDAALTVRSEYGCRKIDVRGSRVQNILPVKLKGNAFSLEIACYKSGAFIEEPVLIFNVKED